MVRITPSSLITFLVVLLVATACEAAGQYKLLNGNSWAKNFPAPGPRPPFNTGIIVDEHFASIYERWAIAPFEDGFSIKNVGTGFWLTARKDEVKGSSEFDEESSKWSIERAGNGKYKIHAPYKDLVVTVRDSQLGNPADLVLKPADGSESQLWELERVNGYYSK